MTNWKDLDNEAIALHEANNAVARAEVARRKHRSDTTERAVERARKQRQKVRDSLLSMCAEGITATRPARARKSA